MIGACLCCCAALVALVVVLRDNRPSLGVPLAFLCMLLFYHVPGALAYIAAPTILLDYDETEIGITLTATACVVFVVSVCLTRLIFGKKVHASAGTKRSFWLFCVLGGWILMFALAPLLRIASISAAIDQGAGIWMLGVILGLRHSIEKKAASMVWWLLAMMVFPISMLLLGGFLSYGTAAISFCLAPLMVRAKKLWRALSGFAVVAVLAFHLFLSYFLSRDEIRGAVWGGADMSVRLNSAGGIGRELSWFDPTNVRQLQALDARLNQNYFIGVAVKRLESGQVDFLRGRSVWEGIQGLVPRILWPDKPVSAGSPGIIMEMTGLQLSEDASWGVGPVMEFYINFGTAGLIVGFAALGCLLAYLDLRAAGAEARGNVRALLIAFLAAIALVRPLGSIVELTSGLVAALVAAMVWSWIWTFLKASQHAINDIYSPPNNGQ